MLSKLRIVSKVGKCTINIILNVYFTFYVFVDLLIRSVYGIVIIYYL